MKNNNFWGPNVWKLIHISALSYNPSKKHSYFSFIYSLPDLLPCEVCRDHLSQNLKNFPLTEEYLQSSDMLFLWTYILHDIVNHQLKKRSPPFDEIKHHYLQNIHNPQYWGPFYWISLHSFATTYDPYNIQSFKKFIYAFPALLPDYSSNFIQVMRYLPLTNEYLLSNENLFVWTYHIHNLINQQLNKSSPPFQNIKQFYFGSLDCDECSVN